MAKFYIGKKSDTLYDKGKIIFVFLSIGVLKFHFKIKFHF